MFSTFLDFRDWRFGLGYLILSYFVVVRLLRYRRRDSVQRLFPDRTSCKHMTVEDAFSIQVALAELEFPTIYSCSVFFALFKVGHPTYELAGSPALML